MLIIVRLDLKEDANIESVLENVDYNFEHEDIIRTEIVEVLNQLIVIKEYENDV